MKNNNNPIFSPGLYLEGIRQSRYIGLPFLCFGALLEAYNLIDALRTMSGVSTWYSYFLAVLSFCVAAPLCVLTLFHFLNSRAASDFYHSIPRTRTALYNSFAAAAFTWSAGPVLIASLWEALMAGICYGELAVGAARAAVISPLCCALVIAACLLGVTLTGTLISQITATGLILFMPRLLITLVTAKVRDMVPTLPQFDYSVTDPVSYRVNLVLDTLVNSLFTTVGWNDGINISWVQIVYTLALTAVYYLIALRLFNTRKSEKASSPAIGRFVQGAIRVLIAFAVCLIACDEIIGRLASRSGYIDISMIALIYGFALLAYFLYEVISIRSVAGLRASAKQLLIGLAVLAALNVVYIGGTVAAINAERNYLPDRDKVDSISLVYSLHDSFRPTYSQLLTSKVVIDDPETINEAIDTLGRCNSSMKSDGSIPDDRYTLAFNFSNGSVKYRTVGFTMTEYERFNKLLNGNEEIRTATQALPEADMIEQCYFSRYDIGTDAALKVWAQLREELLALSPDERHLITQNDMYSDVMMTAVDLPAGAANAAERSTYVLDEVMLYGKAESGYFFERYTITPLTPKTAELYMSLINNEQFGYPQNAPGGNREALEWMKDFLSDYDAHASLGDFYVTISVDGGNLFDENGNYLTTDTQYFECYSKDGDSSEQEQYMSWGLENGGIVRAVDELVACYSDHPTADKPFYRVEIDIAADRSGDEPSSSHHYFYVNAADSDPIIRQWYLGYSPEGLGEEPVPEAAVSESDAD